MAARTRGGLLAVAVITLVTFTGCSFGMTAPPKTPQAGPVKCTDSYAAPIADTIGVVATAILIVPAIVYLLAATYGYATAYSCGRAKQRRPWRGPPEVDASLDPVAEAPVEPTPPEPAPPEPASAPRDDGTIAVDLLFAEFDADPAGAPRTYRQERALRVAGTIELVDRGDDYPGLPYVTLVGKHPLRAVQCFFKDSASLAGLRKGARARLSGEFKEARVNAVLLDCTVLRD